MSLVGLGGGEANIIALIQQEANKAPSRSYLIYIRRALSSIVCRNVHSNIYPPSSELNSIYPLSPGLYSNSPLGVQECFGADSGRSHGPTGVRGGAKLQTSADHEDRLKSGLLFWNWVSGRRRERYSVAVLITAAHRSSYRTTKVRPG